MAAKKKSSETAMEKDLRETKERQAAVNAQWKSHPHAESHFVVPVRNASGDEKDLEVDAERDFVVLNSHGAAYLDSAACVRLMKHLQEAFQVIA